MAVKLERLLRLCHYRVTNQPRQLGGQHQAGEQDRQENPVMGLVHSRCGQTGLAMGLLLHVVGYF